MSDQNTQPPSLDAFQMDSDPASAPTTATASKPQNIVSPTIRFSLTKDIDPDSNLTSEISLQPIQTFQELSIQDKSSNRLTYEPVSIPVSRVTSHEDTSTEFSRLNTHTSLIESSKRPSPQKSSMHTPPITPAATRSQETLEHDLKTQLILQPPDDKPDPAAVTPQISPPTGSPTTSRLEESSVSTSQGDTTSVSPWSGNSRPSSCMFSIGPSGSDIMTPSRDTSPARPSGTSTYSRPFAPSGDINDPYAADKRVPQSKNLDNLDPRFKFTAINSKSRNNSVQLSSMNLYRLPRSTADLNGTDKRISDKRSSKISRDHRSASNEENALTLSNRQGSMVELKRFFKLGGRNKNKRSSSPAISSSNKASSKTESSTHKSLQFPFGDDHALQSKYGKLGKVLGAGAGGSVRLMKRSSDGKTFAVKEFRARHSCESQKDYAKKVTAEFCIGSTLHHGNIIETLDIVCEKDKWYEVMEYAPYDLFAIVMTGKMSKDEICCSFLQILNAVTYLHSMGLAHRDLKLDNIVVNEHGIMKIIDFGSASVFKYPFESGITKASGIVGSDPYLAPEVYDERKYDPQPADIWSLAIIFCCMSLRRFPWKLPRMSDNSYKLFASPPTPGTERNLLLDESKSLNSAADKDTPLNNPSTSLKKPTDQSLLKNDRCSSSQPCHEPERKADTIKGPWRLLRLLPRESRHIIGRMLETDPKKRALMSEIIEDPWVSGTAICTREPGGQVKHAPGHTHTLEPPTPPTGKQQQANHAKHKAKVK